MRGAIRSVWGGERRWLELQYGKDEGSRLAIKTILYHALQNDKKYGRRKYPAADAA